MGAHSELTSRSLAIFFCCYCSVLHGALGCGSAREGRDEATVLKLLHGDYMPGPQMRDLDYWKIWRVFHVVRAGNARGPLRPDDRHQCPCAAAGRNLIRLRRQRAHPLRDPGLVVALTILSRGGVTDEETFDLHLLDLYLVKVVELNEQGTC
jgi:hypothetical protein